MEPEQHVLRVCTTASYPYPWGDFHHDTVYPVTTRRDDVQRFQASRQLQPAPGVGKAEFLADPAAQNSPARELLFVSDYTVALGGLA